MQLFPVLFLTALAAALAVGERTENHDYARNPERLIRQCGLSPDGAPLSATAEKTFLRWLDQADTKDLRPALIVMGGFMDGIRAHAWPIARDLPPELAARHDVYYRQHQEGAATRALAELYAKRGKPVILVGHSWGGDAVVHAVAEATRAPIDLLITLDPVSRNGRPATPPSNVRHWLNVYVDYDNAGWLNYSNDIARLGGPWGAAPAAHHNIPAPGLPHDAAKAMFTRHALPTLERVSAGF